MTVAAEPDQARVWNAADKRPLVSDFGKKGLPSSAALVREAPSWDAPKTSEEAVMDPNRVAEAASLLTAARQQHSELDRLPDACRPQSIAEAHAIQDAVTAQLGAEVRAFKANAPARPAAAARSTEGLDTQANMPWLTPEGVRAPIYEHRDRRSGCRPPRWRCRRPRPHHVP